MSRRGVKRLYGWKCFSLLLLCFHRWRSPRCGEDMWQDECDMPISLTSSKLSSRVLRLRRSREGSNLVDLIDLITCTEQEIRSCRRRSNALSIDLALLWVAWIGRRKYLPTPSRESSHWWFRSGDEPIDKILDDRYTQKVANQRQTTHKGDCDGKEIATQTRKRPQQKQRQISKRSVSFKSILFTVTWANESFPVIYEEVVVSLTQIDSQSRRIQWVFPASQSLKGFVTVTESKASSIEIGRQRTNQRKKKKRERAD